MGNTTLMREAGKTRYVGRYLHKIEIIQHTHPENTCGDV
jgi:hypothetical protein